MTPTVGMLCHNFFIGAFLKANVFFLQLFSFNLLTRGEAIAEPVCSMPKLVPHAWLCQAPVVTVLLLAVRGVIPS